MTPRPGLGAVVKTRTTSSTTTMSLKPTKMHHQAMGSKGSLSLVLLAEPDPLRPDLHLRPPHPRPRPRSSSSSVKAFSRRNVSRPDPPRRRALLSPGAGIPTPGPNLTLVQISRYLAEHPICHRRWKRQVQGQIWMRLRLRCESLSPSLSSKRSRSDIDLPLMRGAAPCHPGTRLRMQGHPQGQCEAAYLAGLHPGRALVHLMVVCHHQSEGRGKANRTITMPRCWTWAHRSLGSTCVETEVREDREVGLGGVIVGVLLSLLLQSRQRQRWRTGRYQQNIEMMR